MVVTRSGRDTALDDDLDGDDAFAPPDIMTDPTIVAMLDQMAKQQATMAALAFAEWAGKENEKKDAIEYENAGNALRAELAAVFDGQTTRIHLKFDEDR